jgi:outer membrane receptor protein involved in Fe transport
LITIIVRMEKRMSNRITRLLVLCCLLPLCGAPAAAQARAGVVLDESGAPVPAANMRLQSTGGAIIGEMVTASDGTFDLPDLPAGSYLLRVEARDFQPRELRLAPGAERLEIVLRVAPLRQEVSITASRGAAEEIASSGSLVSVRDRADLTTRPLPTIGQALEGAPGVLVQESTYGQVSPFLRGLTGYHVLNLIDGVRFNNATFRSGPNQYLALIEPSQVARVEALLGPVSAQYGSDALGGAINLLTLAPRYGDELEVHGEARLSASSADVAFGPEARVTIGDRRVSWLAGGAWRRHQDLRAGSGDDSHHVFRRFFGLTSEQIIDLSGSRQQDTGFDSFGAHTKLAARFARDQSLTLWYQRGELSRVRGYKDLWGGLGRLRSDFSPQTLDFFYARYEKLRLGPLDSLSATFSVNAQGDGSVRQGLNATDVVISDRSRVIAYGYSALGTAHWGRRQALVFGVEVYDERIRASRAETDPQSGIAVEKRALYPNGSRYATWGFYAQDTFEIRRGRLWARAGGRLTLVDFRAFADHNVDRRGQPLGVVDAAQTYRDATFNAQLTWQVKAGLKAHLLTGRGFRAPNLNDLGAQGLNDLGYEIPAAEAVSAGGLIGAGDGEGVASTGRLVSELRAERLFNYEFGLSYRSDRFEARGQIFDAELRDPIVRRTLLFSMERMPGMVGGVAVAPIAPTPAQRAQGVAAVATSLDPRSVKAFVNEGRARYWGVEALAHYAFDAQWTIDLAYSFLSGRELDPNRPVRRLPPQAGSLALRYQPGGARPWIELNGIFAGAQRRLSGGDLTDERIGAARRRRDIIDFFRGALVRPFVRPGSDGVSGTADDIFAPTGETAAQIRDRVLPLGALINGVTVVDETTRIPLYLATPGYATVNLRAGMRILEAVELTGGIMNLFDRNYRVHGSGIDAPGINLFLGLRYSF